MGRLVSMEKNRAIILTAAVLSLLITGVILFFLKEGNNDLDYARAGLDVANGTNRTTDVHAPLIEQWEASSHAKAAESLAQADNAEEVCYSCHSADYFYNNGHKLPVSNMKNGITCIMCHKMTSARLVLVIGDRVQLCTRCHTAGKIEPGKEVRHSQAQVFLGEGAIDIPKTPNSKYEKGVACSDCHMPNKSHEFRALTPSEAKKERRGAICMMCHQNKKREAFAAEVDILQKATEERTQKLLGDLQEIKKQLDLAKEKGQDVGKLKKEYEISYTNVTIVKSDKSKGVHNPKYVNMILEDAERRVAALKKSLE